MANIAKECNEVSKVAGENWRINKVNFEHITNTVIIEDGNVINQDFDSVVKNNSKYIRANCISYLVKVNIQK